jgi:alkanesulfonate monooxygenase SsuD/methylene tetrahydromethanopterin reductase-like flavin-dependent oxidoreductase (luciferase family)
MWRGDTRPFYGRHYQLEEPLNSPAALSQPHPPILVGGGGEKKTLRLVARYADACNLFGRLAKEQLVHKLEVLRGYCEQERRDYDHIEKTVLLSMLDPGQDGANAQALVDELGQLANLGFQTAIVSLREVEALRPIARSLAATCYPESVIWAQCAPRRREPDLDAVLACDGVGRLVVAHRLEHQVPYEPVARQPGDLLERTWLLEQVRRAGHNLEPLLTAELVERRPVQLDHQLVSTANDQQRGRLDSR